MFLNIATVFIAELIILLWLVSGILKLDKKVLTFNSRVDRDKETIIMVISDIRKAVSSLKTSVGSFIELAKCRQREFARKALFSIVMYLLMIFCKGKFKKAAIIFQLAVEIQDCMRNCKV